MVINYKDNISLLDWFAGLSLSAGTVLQGNTIATTADLAEHMYDIATAMTKESQKRQEEALKFKDALIQKLRD